MSDVIWGLAAQQGIQICFANPGTTEMWLVDGLNRADVRSVLCMHENVCTGAADGYARLARKPAVTLLHLGPGLANGLANLHNAKRAASPVVNLVGAMATWHEGADPLLNMNIRALADSVSNFVKIATSVAGLAEDVTAACAATRFAEQAGGSRVSTLIIPHDLTWSACAREPSSLPFESCDGAKACLSSCHSTTINASSMASAATPSSLQPETSIQKVAAAIADIPVQHSAAIKHFITSCAKALQACPKGQCAIYAGGEALLTADGTLESIGKIAAATGADLICENAFARVDRGAGLPHLQRLVYFPQEAAKQLSSYSMMVVIEARLPVAMFGYKDGPSQLVTLPEESIWQLDSSCVNIPWVLQQLAEEVQADNIKPLQNCQGRFCSPHTPPMPSGKLTTTSMCTVIAHLQPDKAIIVDESLTSGGAYWDLSKGCPPFTHLTLTGGAIGSGPPLAVGAAIACPSQVVINIQADGSAMYSLQALWTQAREKLRVITIICANRTYAILKLEMARQKIPGGAQGRAAKGLTDIGQPSIDWVALAQGMGVQHAVKAATAEELAAAFKTALQHDGPSLIECVL